MTGGGEPDVSPRAGFRAVLRIPAFSLVFAAEAQSVVGDQLARVALSVLVFERTGSAPATATSYAATLLPALVGGLLLARVADRVGRRRTMIGCDVVRAVAYAALAIAAPSLPLAITLIVVAVLFGPVFSAAEVSALSSTLTPEEFRIGNALRMVANQSSQVLGFALGGVVVAVLGARTTFALDAATFVISAALVARARLREPARRSAGEDAATTPGSSPGAVRRARGALAVPVTLVLLAGLFVVPEGLAVPFAASLGVGTWQAGVLLAAATLGAAVGALVVVPRIRGEDRLEVTARMALACGVPLLVSALAPPWPVVAVAWAASGVMFAYMVEAMTLVVHAVPDERRAAVVGVVGALLLAAQGAGIVVFGAVAAVVAPGTAVALAGVTGSLVAAGVLVVLTGRRRRPGAADDVTAAGRHRHQA